MDEVQGKVTIAPGVLTMIVRQTVLDESGVSHLAALPTKMRGRGAVEEGIFIVASDEGVKAEVHIVADSQANMLKLGTALQANIARAIEEMVGLPVIAIDVFIDEVAALTAKPA